MLKNKKIGFGITGSFCSINKIFDVMQEIINSGAEIFCFATPNVLTINNRFNQANKVIKKLNDITKKKIISEIQEAEKFGPFNPLDCMVIAPITGNSLAKLSHGIIDNAVLMATKTTLRNGKPIVLAPFTNDALSLNGENIMKLMSKKNFFFVPFGQDDPIKKPTSMTSDLKKLKLAIINALEYKQIQPVIIQNFESKE